MPNIPANASLENRLAAFKPYAEKWAAVFGIPVRYIYAIAIKESGARPKSANTKGPDAEKGRGGAWGIMQVLVVTAQGLAKELKQSTNPDVRATFAKYNGTGQSLLDVDVGTMFGAYLLSKHYRKYNGNFALMAGAYNAGGGAVDKIIKSGAPYPASLPKSAPIYVAKADEILKGLA